jgi:hypothetical protein
MTGARRPEATGKAEAAAALVRQLAASNERLDELMTQARNGEPNALSRLEDVFEGRPGSDLLQIIQNCGGADHTAEVRLALEVARSAYAKNRYRQESDSLSRLWQRLQGSEAATTRDQYEIARAFVDGYEFDLRGDGAWREPLAADLGVTYEDAQARLRVAVNDYYRWLVERAPIDAAARKALQELIEETSRTDCRFRRSGRNRQSTRAGELHLLGVPELSWPEEFDGWVVQQERTPKLWDFSPQPDRSPAEWHRLASAVAEGSENDTHRVKNATIILAACRGSRAICAELDVPLRDQLRKIVAKGRQAMQSAEPE